MFEVSGADLTIIDTRTEWDRPPLVPWTVTVYVPSGTLESTLIVRAEVPDPPVTAAVPREAVSPDWGATTVRSTVAENP